MTWSEWGDLAPAPALMLVDDFADAHVEDVADHGGVGVPVFAVGEDGHLKRCFDLGFQRALRFGRGRWFAGCLRVRHAGYRFQLLAIFSPERPTM